MSNVMEALYNEWADKEIELSLEYKRILNKYAKDFGECIDITDVIVSEQRKAFSAGFKTAVQLLMGGGQE